MLRLRTALSAGLPSALRRLFSTAVATKAQLARPAELALPNVHRSDAELRVARVPVVEVDAEVAMCDGGGGATGHPIEYVKLELREGHAAVPCKYCGVRYRRAAAHHH